MLVYLEDSLQDTAEGLIKSFSRSAEFLSLNPAGLFLLNRRGQTLRLVASTESPSPQPILLELATEVKLVWQTGRVHLLRPSEIELWSPFLKSTGLSLTIPVVLPLTTTRHELIGAILLTNPPLFDLEDQVFTSLWFTWHNHLIKRLAPSLPEKPTDLKSRFQRPLGQGHRLLHLSLPLEPFLASAELQGQAIQAYLHRTWKALHELAGETGAAWSDETHLHSVFLLPARMDPQLLVHQVKRAIPWVSEQPWMTSIISTSNTSPLWD